MFKPLTTENLCFAPAHLDSHPEQKNLHRELAHLEELLSQHQHGNEAPDLEVQIQQQFALINTLKASSGF